VEVLFQYGKFSTEASALTTWALAAFCIGLFAYAAVKILAAAFYAYQTTRVPVIIASTCVGLNIALNIGTLMARHRLSLSHPEWADMLNGRIGVGCLALATSIASWVNAVSLLVLLRRKLGHLGGGRILRTALKSSVGCLAMGIFAWGVVHLKIASFGLLSDHVRIARGLELATAIAGGAFIYMLTAKLLRMEEWEPFLAQMRK
jgi:putative peptidoglycan lipid II flippase